MGVSRRLRRPRRNADLKQRIREAREECGLDVRLDGLVNIYSYAGRAPVIVVYAATAIGGTLCADEECLETAEFEKSAIPVGQSRVPQHRRRLARLSGRPSASCQTVGVISQDFEVGPITSSQDRGWAYRLCNPHKVQRDCENGDGAQNQGRGGAGGFTPRGRPVRDGLWIRARKKRDRSEFRPEFERQQRPDIER